MSGFEFVFSLFALLLGFSLIEVLTGFVRTMKARKQVRLGWLTPLLGILVMFHLTSWWSDAYDLRELIPASDRSLFVGLIIAGVYYFAASMVFPEKPEQWPDLDVYYFEVKRTVLGCVLACDFMTYMATRALTGEEWDTGHLIGLGVVAILVPVAILAKGKKLNLFILLLIAVPMILGGLMREAPGAARKAVGTSPADRYLAPR